MSNDQRGQLPSISQQFPEVFTEKPQSPPGTPTPPSPSSHALPPRKRRRSSDRDEPDQDERERKRPTMYSVSGGPPAYQPVQSSTALGPPPHAPSPLPPPAPLQRLQLPPLRTYLRQQDDKAQMRSPPKSAGVSQPENYALSQPSPRDSGHLSQRPGPLEPPRYYRSRSSDRKGSREMQASDYPFSRADRPPVHAAPTLRGNEWVASPTHVTNGASPSTVTSSYPPLRPPLREEFHRPYSTTSPTHVSSYPSVAQSIEDRRYPAEHLRGPIHTSPTDLTRGYPWEAPLAGASSTSAPSLSNPNGRKRRGNLPKESTQVLNEWFLKHINFPYPKESEKQQLQAATGLSLSQISNWFINARRRRRPDTGAAVPAVHPQDPREVQPLPTGAPPSLGQQTYAPRDQWGRSM